MSPQLAEVLFKGGPCAGQRGDADPDQLGTGTILCGGINYHLYLLTSDTYLAILPGAKPPPEDAVAKPAGPANPVDALAAWQAFGRKVGHDLPGYVNTTTRLRAGIRQIGRG